MGTRNKLDSSHAFMQTISFNSPPPKIWIPSEVAMAYE